LRAAGNEGWLGLLIEAHLTPCDQARARWLLVLADCSHIPVRFNETRKVRGRFYKPFRTPGARQAAISLPGQPGSRFGYLRVGIVLHEAAHALAYRKCSNLNHQKPFQREFRSLLRKLMTPSPTPLNFRPIYDRHQGPYVLLLTRVDNKGAEFSDRITDISLRAQAAHEKAIELIENRDPKKPDVTRVFVFSETEGQFTGALYQRGEAYAAWQHLPMDDAAPAPRAVVKRATVKETAAKTYPAANAIVQGEAAAAAGLTGHTMVDGDLVAAGLADSPRVPKLQRPAKLPGDRFPVMRGRPLVHDPEGSWPKSAPAQFVKSFFGQQPPDYSATSAELVAAIGQSLTDLGVQFPASLISRLKQAGLLKEKTHESQEPQGDAPEQSATESTS
jgi:hypothetical protein